MMKIIYYCNFSCNFFCVVDFLYITMTNFLKSKLNNFINIEKESKNKKVIKKLIKIIKKHNIFTYKLLLLYPF